LVNESLDIIIDYKGPIWENKEKKEVHPILKGKLVATYKAVGKSLATTKRIMRNSFPEEIDLKLTKLKLQTWERELKNQNTNLEVAIENQEKEMMEIYRTIKDKALQNTKQIVDLIPQRTDRMSAESLSKTAVNLVNIIEKMDSLDPRNKDTEDDLKADVIVNILSVEQKIILLEKYAHLFPEQSKNLINTITDKFRSMKDNNEENTNDDNVIEAELVETEKDNDGDANC
jgi:hypothetical protein